MFRNIFLILTLFFFAVSCGDTIGSVKRGLTGAKANQADEFLVKKKDPLILPPDFENLPTPDERSDVEEEISIIEKKIGTSVEGEDTKSSSVEESILKKIQSK